MFALNQHCKSWQVINLKKEQRTRRMRQVRRSSNRILGGRSNSVFGHKSFLLKRYPICQTKSSIMLCFKWKWKEEKVQQQSNERWGKMFYIISIFSKRSYGSWVSEILPSNSWNDNNNTKARLLHHNVLVATNMRFPFR